MTGRSLRTCFYAFFCVLFFGPKTLFFRVRVLCQNNPFFGSVFLPKNLGEGGTCFSISFGRSPSELIMQAAHLLQGFSASALTAAFSRGLSCSRRSRMWVAILNFFTEQKLAAAAEELQRTLARRWLHTQIRDLKTQAAHAAHQPQAARSQPNAFQKRAWAGSLAFSIQSPPRDCFTGSSRSRQTSRPSTCWRAWWPRRAPLTAWT